MRSCGVAPGPAALPPAALKTASAAAVRPDPARAPFGGNPGAVVTTSFDGHFDTPTSLRNFIRNP